MVTKIELDLAEVKELHAKLGEIIEGKKEYIPYYPYYPTINIPYYRIYDPLVYPTGLDFGSSVTITTSDSCNCKNDKGE